MTTVKKRHKTTKVTMAEIQRQAAELKLEKANLEEKVRALEAQNMELADKPPLGDHWTLMPDETYMLEGSDGTITKIEQEGDQPVLYEIAAGGHSGYFPAIADAAEQGEIWAKFRSRDVKYNPVSIRQLYESGAEPMPEAPAREMKSTGPASEALDPIEFVKVDKRYSASKLETLAFMEEYVEIEIQDTNNATDAAIPCFYNDGRSQYFIRGREQTVKRKFLSQIATCHVTTYGDETFEDPAGDTAHRYPAKTVLAYPFRVIRDDNPKGADWLKGLQAQGA